MLEELLNVGIALSSTRDLRELLTLILREARRFTSADAGTLYLVKGGVLRAEVAQCQTFVERLGQEQADSLFSSFSLPVNMKSIAGAAAFTREVVNIPDVQNVDVSCLFQYSPDFDRKNNYSTHSNLAVPMLDREQNVIGVLQLINAKYKNRVVPFDARKTRLAQALASQAGVAIRNTLLTASLREAHLETLQRLGVAAEWRDKETANHIIRVAKFSALIAEALGWSEEMADMVEYASPMHDVGKLGIPDSILHKPGKLDPDERTIMEKHTVIGANILSNAKNEVMQWSRMVALGHHEKWDGSGYPQGISGSDIPPICQIVALADVYDALSCKRVYKPAFPHEKVMAIIHEENGRHFAPQMVKAFAGVIDRIVAVRDEYADKEEDFAKFRDYANIGIE
jgi:response regulator RpfG family c-di-GMP phosphodiesterase